MQIHFLGRITIMTQMCQSKLNIPYAFDDVGANEGQGGTGKQAEI